MQLRNMCNWSSKKMFYQSQVFKQNITRQKCFHSKPHTTHQFEKKKKNGKASTTLQELEICGFLFQPANTLTP